MKISIIIPIYNVELYVKRCLQSVMSQTYQGPLECLLVDDCGSDHSMDVVKQMITDYQGSICFNILHHDQNRGLSAARNTGMDAATGDYLFFLDSDDEIKDDCIEKMTKPLEEEKYDIVVGNVQTIGDDSLGAFLSLKLDDGVVLHKKNIEDTYRKKWNMIAQNKLYRTKFIREQRLQFKEGLVHEDELWSLQVACLAKSLRAVNQFTYLYYIRDNSLTTSDKIRDRKAKMLKIVVAEICLFLKERKIFSVRAYQLVNKFLWDSLNPSLGNKYQFIRDYCEFRKNSLPLWYCIKAERMNFRAQKGNLYYIIPSKLAARILYWRKKTLIK